MGSRKRKQKQQRPSRTKTKSPAKRAAPVDAWTTRLQAARRAWSSGDHAAAIALYDAAVAKEPNNVRAYYQAARAHAELLDFKRFEDLINRMRAVAPRHAGVHHLAGELYEWLALPRRAHECFEKAAQTNNALPESLIELAKQQERLHQLSSAKELVERALASKPDLPQARLLQARLLRRVGELTESAAKIEGLIDTLPANAPPRLEALGELCLLRDQQGDYFAAVQAIEQCKRQQLAIDSAQWKASEHVLNRFGHAVETITPDDFRRWHDDAKQFVPVPIALLTGFPRSGTTLLEQVINTHPQIVSSEERDFVSRHFFPSIHGSKNHDTPVQDVLHQVGTRRLQSERKRYLSAVEYCLGEPINGRWLLDKNPAYNPVLPIMLRLFPETRVIVALRDPRDVVLSCFLRYLPLNPVSVRFLTIERTTQRYALDMQAWVTYREMLHTRWCEVRYEDAVRDLEGETRKALATIGVEWDNVLREYRQRLTASAVMSPTYEAVAAPVHDRAIGRWKNYTSLLEPAFDQLQQFVDRFGYDG